MKKLVFCFVLLCTVTFSVLSQQIDCIFCDENNLGILSSAIGAENTSTGDYSFASGYLNSATGNYSSAFGISSLSTGESSIAVGKDVHSTGNFSSAFGDNSKSTGKSAFAGGSFAEANGVYSLSLGRHTYANAQSSVAIGKYLEIIDGATSAFAFGTFISNYAPFAFVIGTGNADDKRLVNHVSNSLMLGFNSKFPTLFVSPADGSEKTGKIGIGNVTMPEAKLHIKADNDEDASLKLEPTGEPFSANILLGDDQHIISSKAGDDLKFSIPAGNNFIYENGNIGVDTYDPVAKIQVKNGDIFIEDINRGIIMKSPDGNCWRGTLNNSGSLQFIQVNCDNLLSGSNEVESENLQGILIYPNPTVSYVFISFSEKFQDISIEIIDLNGTVLYSEKLPNNESFVDVSNYQSGIYLFNIKESNGLILKSSRIIKK